MGFYDTDEINLKTVSVSASGKVTEGIAEAVPCRVEFSSAVLYKDGKYIKANALIMLSADIDVDFSYLVQISKKNGVAWKDLKFYEIIDIRVPDGFGNEYREVYI